MENHILIIFPFIMTYSVPLTLHRHLRTTAATAPTSSSSVEPAVVPFPVVPSPVTVAVMAGRVVFGISVSAMFCVGIIV